MFLRTLYLIRNGGFRKGSDGKKDSIKYIICIFLNKVLTLVPYSRKIIYNRYKKLSQRYYRKTNTYTALCDPGAKKLMLTKEDIFPLKEMPFEGVTIKMVNRYDKMLSTHMGNYMEIPPENKRTNHCPKVLEFGDR